MFNFFKKSLSKSNILEGNTDVHCHILPGVDDGTQKMEDCLRALQYYEDHGLKRLFFTPHIAQSLHENTRENLTRRFEEVKSRYKGKMELRLGAEYMLDNNFDKLLDDKEEFLCASPGTILIETTAVSAPMDMDEVIYELQQSGYTIMLAHPERYLYMSKDDYYNLKQKDVKFQMNILSLDGTYGEHAYKKAQWLIKEGMYDYCGSDWHKFSFHTAHYHEKGFSSSAIDAIGKMLQNNNNLE